MLRDRIKCVTDRIGWCGDANLHRGGFVQDVFGQTSDFRRHGCREDHRLAFGRKMADNPPDIGKEPHIQHLIGFIQNQHFQPGKIDAVATDMVKQTTGAGHNDIGSLQILNLPMDPHTAIDSNASKVRVMAERFNRLMNLFSQFAGWVQRSGRE